MTETPKSPEEAPKKAENIQDKSDKTPSKEGVKEIGGRGGLDPVRYGDWEVGGKCVDF